MPLALQHLRQAAIKQGACKADLQLARLALRHLARFAHGRARLRQQGAHVRQVPHFLARNQREIVVRLIEQEAELQFGIKLAQAHAEFQRARERLVMARKEIATCAISGAVGTFANIDPRVEEYVAEKMGLTPEPVSTQVIPRDRHAMYSAALAVVGVALSVAMVWVVAKIAEALAPQLGGRPKIKTEGRADSEAVASNDTPEGRAQNRRVEIFLREPQQPS